MFKQLAADTGIDKRTLYQCAQFYRFFPIVSTCSQLGWGHYRVLCQAADETQRSRLQASAVKNKWTCQELAERVRPLNAAMNLIADSNGANDDKSSAKLLTPKRGTVGLYRVITRDGGPAIDVGFKLYLPLSPAQARVRKAGQIVRLGGDRITVVEDAKPSEMIATSRMSLWRPAAAATCLSTTPCSNGVSPSARTPGSSAIGRSRPCDDRVMNVNGSRY